MWEFKSKAGWTNHQPISINLLFTALILATSHHINVTYVFPKSEKNRFWKNVFIALLESSDQVKLRNKDARIASLPIRYVTDKIRTNVLIRIDFFGQKWLLGPRTLANLENIVLLTELLPRTILAEWYSKRPYFSTYGSFTSRDELGQPFLNPFCFSS